MESKKGKKFDKASIGLVNSSFVFNTFESKERLVEILATRIINNLSFAIETKGSATLALSGGSTPKKLLNALSERELAWESVTITLVDERWVESSSSASNEKLICDTLLQNRASRAKFVALKNSAPTAKEGVEALSKRLSLIKQLDVVVLGMGVDAHTASFFPQTQELQEALTTEALCCATFAPTEPKERITLSRSFLLHSKNLILHIEGAEKKALYEKATKSDKITLMPIIAMMKQPQPILEVYYAE